MDNPSKGIGPSDISTTNTPTILTPTNPASSRASWMTRNPALTDPSQSPEDRWREGIDPAKSSVADIITYTKRRMRVYEEEDLRGESLSEAFFVDFEHFEQETFKACGTDTTRHLRDLLRERGVYARKGRGVRYDLALAEAVREEIPWPEDDPERPKQTSRPTPKTERPSSPTYPTEPPPQTRLSGHTKQESKRFPIRPIWGPPPREHDTEEQPWPRQQKSEDEIWPGQRQREERTQRRDPASETFVGIDSQSRHRPPLPPPVDQRIATNQNPSPREPVPQTRIRDVEEKVRKAFGLANPADYSKPLAALAKLYSDNLRYGGDPDDSFERKFNIFADQCHKACVPGEALPHSFSTMLKGKALDYYYGNCRDRVMPLAELYHMIESHFEGPEHKRGKLREWNQTTLRTYIDKMPGQPMSTVYRSMVEELQKTQLSLDTRYRSNEALWDKLLAACEGIPACTSTVANPPETTQGLINALYSAIMSDEATARAQQLNPLPTSMTYTARGTVGDAADGGAADSFMTDRRYHQADPTQPRRPKAKTCFVCKKPGCWSTKHTPEERRKTTDAFKATLARFGKRNDDTSVRQYITDWEGMPDEEAEITKEMEVFVLDLDGDDEGEEEVTGTTYLTSFGNINGDEAVELLCNASTFHALTKSSMVDEAHAMNPARRPGEEKFMGIMLDSGAGVSTAGLAQAKALMRERPNIRLDESRAGVAKVRFGPGTPITSIGTIDVDTPIGMVTFHVIPSETPFLLSLNDLDQRHAELANLNNVVVQGSKKIPVTRRNRHAYMHLDPTMETLVQSSTIPTLPIATCHLTEAELRQLHRRFGHPSARRLERVLRRAGHEVEHKAIERLTRFCHACQLHGKSPGRFKFTVHDDREFNASVYVDVMYIEGQPVLHVVDEATRFQAARWLRNMSAQHAWDTLRACWIDVYVGPPDEIVHDAGTNFDAAEFRQYAASMTIGINQVPVEAHQSVGIVERYHAPLRRAYKIIKDEFDVNGTADGGKGIDKTMMLQMAVKAVNDTAGPDGLVPTLLVFGAYPRMSELDPPAPTISQRATAIARAMEEVRK
jgi:hypothetical protein